MTTELSSRLDFLIAAANFSSRSLLPSDGGRLLHFFVLIMFFPSVEDRLLLLRKYDCLRALSITQDASHVLSGSTHHVRDKVCAMISARVLKLTTCLFCSQVSSPMRRGRGTVGLHRVQDRMSQSTDTTESVSPLASHKPGEGCRSVCWLHIHLFPANLGDSACISEIVQAISAVRQFGGRSGMVRQPQCRKWLHFNRSTCRLSKIGRKKV